MKKIIVLAGNVEQFRNYIISHNKSFRYFIYGSDIKAIAGIEAEEVIIVGTFWDREDAVKLKEFADSRIVKGGENQ